MKKPPRGRIRGDGPPGRVAGVASQAECPWLMPQAVTLIVEPVPGPKSLLAILAYCSVSCWASLPISVAFSEPLASP